MYQDFIRKNIKLSELGWESNVFIPGKKQIKPIINNNEKNK